MKPRSLNSRVKRRALPLFRHLLQLGRREVRPLERVTKTNGGYSALEWFVANESEGLNLPTRHPLLVEKIIVGRWVKGVTKDMWVEDLALGVLSPQEVREMAFSPEDAQDVINRARAFAYTKEQKAQANYFVKLELRKINNQ